MKLTTPSSPHSHAEVGITGIMLRVILAMVPGIAAYVWFFGYGLLVNMLLTVTTALVCETMLLKMRSRPIKPFITDLSAIVTAMLLALAIPPLVPWWVPVTGTLFAIVFAKHLYGGLGYNPFNPAMVGYAMLLISFPVEMTSWIAIASFNEFNPGPIEALLFSLTGQLPGNLALDAMTEATPLDTLKMLLSLDNTVDEVRATLGLDEETSRLLSVIPIFGAIGGKGWEWISGGFLIGGLWLIYLRIISWHIPVAMIASLTIISGLFFLFSPEHHASPLFHIFSGAVILGAFFIATDPVTAASSPTGRLVYGAGIGILVYVIRVWGGYPDSIAFAVLLMNMVVPVIDHYFRPRVFGHGK